MKKKLRRSAVRGLLAAALWMAVWGVMDDSALEMAAEPSARYEETRDQPVEFYFPWLEWLLGLFRGGA